MNDFVPLEEAERFAIKPKPNGSERLPRFQISRFADIKPDSAAQYLIKGLLQRTGLAVVWGAPKCGKSFWTFDLLMHVALGWPYRGHRVMPGAVVYCALEGAQGFKNRIEAFRQAKLSEADVGDPPFYLMATPLSLVRDHKAFIADIRKQLGDDKPAVVCVDTLNRSLEGSESSDEDMTAYVRAADAIRDAFGCLVVIVHHCGHNGDRPRGHSSLMGALDVQIAVRRDGANNITAELELSKDGDVGLQFVSRLRVIDIGTDQDGDPITSCVIEEVDGGARTKASAKGRPMSKQAQIALRALHKTIADVGHHAPASNDIPQNVRVATVEKWRTRAYLAGISDSEEIKSRQKAFKRAHEALVADHVVAECTGHVWIAKD
jgi:hypothetical protein